MKTIAAPGVAAALATRLAALRPDTPRRWGTLTAGEMLCHLADSGASVLGQRPRSGPPALAASRRFVKWASLYTALPWPKDVKTRASVDPRLGGTRPGDFEEDRRRVIAGLAELSAAPAAAFAAAHLYFGAMSRRDWQRWAYRHVDHHLRQFGV
jgi:Protein of unknown function (DUF1569)